MRPKKGMLWRIVEPTGVGVTLHMSSSVGAVWRACDLHVHTPFDRTKKFGEDIRKVHEQRDKGNLDPLRRVAFKFFDSCSQAGLDLVALTDHNSVEGYELITPHLPEWVKSTGASLEILPGVEVTVGTERNLHVLLVIEKKAKPDTVNRLLTVLFNGLPQADGQGYPLSCNRSLQDFCKGVEDFMDHENLAYLLIPAHVNRASGIESEMRSPAAWTQELKNRVRAKAFQHRSWAGFQIRGDYTKIPQVQDLLRVWASAFFWGKAYDQLTPEERASVDAKRHWPLIEASDPECNGDIGYAFTWMKMEETNVEGIRLALLDPESRLRRSSEGAPTSDYPQIVSIRIKDTDFFGRLSVPFSPNLTTLIGGRGTGKSTALEYLRYGLKLDTDDQFPEGRGTGETRNTVHDILLLKQARDYGETKGTLLPTHAVEVDVEVAGRTYTVRRTAKDFSITSPGIDASLTDIYQLIRPRILSQGQIAEIARDRQAQRRELDAIVDQRERVEIDRQRSEVLESLRELQTSRKRAHGFTERLSTLSTELQTVSDSLKVLERPETTAPLAAFQRLERERVWLDEMVTDLGEGATRATDLARSLNGLLRGAPEGSRETEEWVRSVVDRARTLHGVINARLAESAQALRELANTIVTERRAHWDPAYEAIHTSYQQAVEALKESKVTVEAHDGLMEHKVEIEAEISRLRASIESVKNLDKEIRDAWKELVAVHERRHRLRASAAELLERSNADIRLVVRKFADASEFMEMKDRWFPKAGVQQRDWDAMRDFVFGDGGGHLDRLERLVAAVREDAQKAERIGRALEDSESAVAELIKPGTVTKNFHNALSKAERLDLDAMELYLPEDAVEARVRAGDEFKPIETGSVGQRSTAVISLLLCSGSDPLVIDQPESDLDNRYVYDVVVNLLRTRKFGRQIVIATHNPNIPVNGDAELIVALDVDHQEGVVACQGSIDRSDVKGKVSEVMEGSREAFRLRRERYGF